HYIEYHHLSAFHLFGHSFGGRISLVLGADHADPIRSMVLADSAGVLSKSSSSNSLRLKSYRFALNTLNTIGLQQTAGQLRQWYGDRYGSPDYKAAKGILRETFVKVVNQDLLPYAARVKPSTLLVWGDQDEDTPLWQGQLLEKTIPDAGLIIYEGAGHYSYLDRLHEVTKVMDHFFRQASGL
ncbi:MAG: alpha/beta hydrolase, partial [Anaerolineae bacterium]|nr:alpha/beta hydrolase [Anaerolineae bacterium]